MTDQDDDRPLIRNEDTLRRRAWIDRALAGVRQRLMPTDPVAEPGVAPPAEATTPPVPVAPGAEAGEAPRPRLYLVGGNDRR